MKQTRSINVLFAMLAMVFCMTGAASAQDFNFTISPNQISLIPGDNSSFLISVTTTGGFTNPVTFSVSNLPSGVTASFSPNPVTPPGDTLLTLNASSSATAGTNTLYFTGVGGGITNTTSTTATVEFGLVPLCYGAYAGQITDTNGNPVPYAQVIVEGYDYYSVLADVHGNYIITNIGLGSPDNNPINYEIEATRSNYWATTTNAYAVCDTTNIVNIQIVPQIPGSITGIVKSEGGQVLTNVSVSAETYLYGYSTNTDSTGAFAFPSVEVANDNAAASYTISASLAGYWQYSTNVVVQSASNTVVTLVLIPICYDTVSGKVIYGNSGLPVTNQELTLTSSQYYYPTTDANGNYTVTNVELTTDNNQVYASVSAYVSGYYQGGTNVLLTNCGESVTMPTLVLSPIPSVTNNYGAVTGQVFDITSGKTISNAYIYSYDGSAYSGTNGFYAISNLLVGQGTVTNTEYGFSASATGYFSTSSNVEVYANETSSLNFYLLQIDYGAIDGIVLDQSTGLPVEGANVYFSPYGTATNTGPTGNFYSTPIQLAAGNTPIFESVSVNKTGYWSTNVYTYVTNGVTDFVTVELLPVCTGATVLGKVVNANTQAPISDAYVIAGNLSTYTDTNGNFIITNISVGDNNSPEQVAVTAEATGYITQTKYVEIFCGASINTEFGVPETEFGAIQGYVSNIVTGVPLTNVFIGTSYGGTTNTDTNGFYFLSQVPILQSNQTWTVTASPTAYGYPAITKTTGVVSTNTTNEVDFGFGGPTTLGVASVQTPSSTLTVGESLEFTVTLTNLGSVASNVVLVDTLPSSLLYVSSTLVPSTGPFSTPVYVNGTVVTSNNAFQSGGILTLEITGTTTTTGQLTNFVDVTTTSPVTTNSVLSATNMNVAAAQPTTNFADLALQMVGVPNPIPVGNQLTYTITVTNLGPADAPDVYVTDTFPSSVTVILPPTLSQGDYTYDTSTKVLIWDVGDLNPSNGPNTATATIIVTPNVAEEIENIATVAVNWVSTNTPPVIVIDPNSSNNTADVFTEVTAELTTNAVTYSSVTFNPQTGLFEQTVTFNNNSDSFDSNVLVEILDVPANVKVYNESGVTNLAPATGNVPYLAYNQLLPAGSNATFLVEYYEANRKPFEPTNFVGIVNVIIPPVQPPSGGTSTTNYTTIFNEGEFIIEFSTTVGRSYVIEYSSSMTGPWITVTPPIKAVNNRTLWVDSGPPATASPPSFSGNRFYQIVELPQ